MVNYVDKDGVDLDVVGSEENVDRIIRRTARLHATGATEGFVVVNIPTGLMGDTFEFYEALDDFLAKYDPAFTRIPR